MKVACTTIPAGSRLQVDVVSTNFPRRARNTNSGNALMARDTDADIRLATNTVHHGADAPSFGIDGVAGHGYRARSWK